MSSSIQKMGGNIPVTLMYFLLIRKKKINFCFVTVTSKYTNVFNSFKIIIDYIYITLVIFVRR